MGLIFQPPRVPLTDPKTGLITREWYAFFQAQYQRVGGPDAPTPAELAVSMPDDGGLEEVKAFAYANRDEAASGPPPIEATQQDDQAPPGALFIHEQDPSARIQALEALVQQMASKIEALEQGITA